MVEDRSAGQGSGVSPEASREGDGPAVVEPEGVEVYAATGIGRGLRGEVEASGLVDEEAEPGVEEECGAGAGGEAEERRALGLSGRRRGSPSRRWKEGSESRPTFTATQRLLLLDSWQRSKLAAREFGSLVGVSGHTLYQWKKQFEREGPAGLADHPRGGPSGSRLSAPTQRAILMLKQSHPEWGCERIRDVLLRGEGFGASAGAIRRVLQEGGYEVEEEPTRPHAPREVRFERSRPNQLWQSDLFTFLLKRENRRVYLTVFLDDHSRFVVSYALQATASGALVREALEAGIAAFGPPEEVLTDQGPQYHTWRGKSAFTRLLERRGIRHLVARPRHPQTLGKTERFWGTLWRECVEGSVFVDVEEARRRVGHFIDAYNFQRPHQGIEGLVPADRFFGAASEMREALESRVAANAMDLARYGVPRQTVYLAGRVGEESISLHGEGSRVILVKGDGSREEVELSSLGKRAEGEAPTLPEPAAVVGRVVAEGEEEDEGVRP